SIGCIYGASCCNRAGYKLVQAPHPPSREFKAMRIGDNARSAPLDMERKLLESCSSGLATEYQRVVRWISLGPHGPDSEVRRSKLPRHAVLSSKSAKSHFYLVLIYFEVKMQAQ